MKVKGILAVVLAALISFGAGLGTLAFYQSTFTSQGDFEAAEWNITAEEIGAGLEFNNSFDNLQLAPGRSENYDFRIRRNETEVDYVIKVDVQSTGDLFAPNGEIPTPVLLTLGSDTVEPIVLTPGDADDEYELEVTNTGSYADFFTLKVDWPWETPDFVDPITGNSYDNLWANKLGNIKIKVVVEQKKDWGEVATMRFRIKSGDSAYEDIAAYIGQIDGQPIDRTLTGKMVIEGNNVTFKVNDPMFGAVELDNRKLSFTDIGKTLNLNSQNLIPSGDNDALVKSTTTDVWLNFVE